MTSLVFVCECGQLYVDDFVISSDDDGNCLFLLWSCAATIPHSNRRKSVTLC